MSVEHFSRFGGLWTDRKDAQQLLLDKLYDGSVTHEEAKRLRDFIASGHLVVEEAVPAAVIDKLEAELSRAFARDDERLVVREPSDPAGGPPAPGDSQPLVDLHALFAPAREALLAAPIVRFLTLIFEDDPLLFQSHKFDRGSAQGMHQDTAYVVTSAPLELAATWIALEDIRPGTGELMYYEGSHRLDDYLFGRGRKHWDPERDGDEAHERFLRHLEQDPPKLGMTRRTFLPRKGDAMIWAADLAHGGSPVADPTSTCKSIVGHYCPTRVEPQYFTDAPAHRTKCAFEGGSYASRHYLLPPDEPAADAEVEEAELVNGVHHRPRRFARRIFSWRDR